MSETRSGTTRSSWLRPACALTLALGAGAAGAPSVHAQSEGMVLNSATTEAYRQQAVEGRRQHDFSPRRPPRNGRNVYGHWTPYEPPDPATYPPGATTHVIVRGDTLWDLAGRFYRDNLLWPYLWDANPWVTYPHWIYPGDVLLVPNLMMMPEGSLQAEAQIPSILDGFFPAAAQDAAECGHFVADKDRIWPAKIIAFEADPAPVTATQDEVVYINVGAKDGVLPGDEFAILYPREHLGVSATERDLVDDQLHHPMTGEKLGVIMKMAGRVKVILLGDEVSTARVTRACDSVEVGYRLQPFTEVPMPLVRRKSRERYFNEMPKRGRGFVAWINERAEVGVPGQLLTIDLGTRQGVIPGDVFRIYREHPHDWFLTDVEHVGDFADFVGARRKMRQRRDENEKFVYGKQGKIPKAPPRMVGEIVVLFAEQDTATARSFSGHQEFYPGDRIVYEPVDTGLEHVAVVNQPLVPDVPLPRQPRELLPEEGEDDAKQ